MKFKIPIVISFLYLSITFVQAKPRTTLSEVYVGTGFNTESKAFGSAVCYDFEEMKYELPDDKNYTDNYINTETLIKELNFDPELSSTFLTFESNEFMEYFSKIKDRENFFTFHYLSRQMVYETIKYRPDDKLLTDKGKEVLKKDKKNFRAICGDQLVTSIYAGDGVIVSFALTFHSADIRNTFVKKFGTDVSISLSFTFISHIFEEMRLTYEEKARSYLEIFVYEIDSEKKKAFDADERYIRCSIAEISKCNKNYMLATDYITRYVPGAMSTVVLLGFGLDKTVDNIFDIGEPYLKTQEAKDQQLKYKNTFSNFQVLLHHYNFLYNMLEIRTGQLPGLYYDMKEIRENYFKNSKAYECYINLVNFEKCSKSILKDLSRTITSAKSFQKSFEEINEIEFNIKDSYCLKSPFNWGSEETIRIFWYSDSMSQKNIFGTSTAGRFSCRRLEEEKGNEVVCDDSLIYLKFSLSEQGSGKYEVKCTNDFLKVTAQPFTVESKTIRNPFSVSLNNW